MAEQQYGKQGMGNEVDLWKHPHLIKFAKAVKPSTYVEFHSGAGLSSSGYKGSSIQVLENIGYDVAFLHEKDEGIREDLDRNLGAFPNVSIRGKWEDDIDEYIRDAKKNWLFLIDPTSIRNYSVQLYNTMEKLMKNGASMFLYVPQKKYKNTDKEKMRDLEIMIRQVPQNGLILTREFGKEGFPRRQDHLIFVSNQNNLNILLSKIDDSQEIRWI